MSTIDIRRPNITGNTPQEQLLQMRSSLYQISEQLNWAFNTIQVGAGSPTVNVQQSTTSEATSPEEVQNSFNEIKALIIKSADIVDAYYDKICQKLEGEYKGLSDFGNFYQKTTAYLEANPTEALVKFTNLQSIQNTLDKIGEELDQEIRTDARIKAGLMGYEESGAPIYGLEVWQRDDYDNEKLVERFARLSANKLAFYDKNDAEVAYISDYLLYITNAKFTGDVIMGGYKYDTSDGIAHVWIGRS